MIDLKDLAEYARRSGQMIPASIIPHNPPDDLIAEQAGLAEAWLQNWRWLRLETRQILAEYVGFDRPEDLLAEIRLQGLKLVLRWMCEHGDVPHRVKELRTAVMEAGRND